MTLSNAQASNREHILLNNFRSIHSFVMKMSSLCNIAIEKFLSENSMKNIAWTLVPDPF